MFEETGALRSGRNNGDNHYSSDHKYRSATVSTATLWGYVIGPIIVIVICMVCCCYWRRKRSSYEHIEQTKRLTAAIPRMTSTDRRKEPIVMFSCHSNQQRLNSSPAPPIEDSGFHE
ncbi:Hypothetical predicted protein [Mytilus galloprovincialis]|uniref:Uncharacterized protein n=1 Tax=Mytilus galloprovincialis TaxID=29158 RepID=A0A8B6FI12_MYTGA|nr:Hypothetical predicted protein [Mytilus galloprovincialis]